MDLFFLSMFEAEIASLLFTIVAVIFGLIVKDVLSTSAFGILFFLDRNFHEGDNVYINGQLATIVKISLTKSIFKMYDNSRWKYVHNSRIRFLDLEKVVEPDKNTKEKV